MMTPKGKCYVEFCNGIADRVIEQAMAHDRNPRIVFDNIRGAFFNRLACIEKSNSDRRSDMVDAMLSAPPGFANTCHIYAEGEWGHKKPLYIYPELDRIIYSGNRTIVFWKDGTKTVVKCKKDDKFDEYSGFVAAFAKKAFGSTHHLKKLISRAKVSQNKKNKKDKTDGSI